MPEKVYVIDESLPAKLFNQDISHHPNYNPHQVSFCYQGEQEEFDGKVTQQNWEQAIIPIFLQNNKPKNIQNDIQPQFVGLEKVILDIKLVEDRFVFLALRYHPNLYASIDGKIQKIYQAQANTIALKLPQGNYQMSIYYHHPWYDLLGKYISIATVLALIVMCGYGKLKSKTK